MLTTIDYNLQSELQQELIPDEKLLWTGQPPTGIIFRKTDILLIPFSLMWCGFVIFWESSVVLAGPTFFMLWGIPFVCAGLYIVVGRFFYDKFDRANTVYGITSKRIIIKSGVFKKSIESFTIQILVNLKLEVKANGGGIIELEPNKNPFGFEIKGWPGNKKTPSIELSDDIREVYNLILKLQHQPA